MLQNYEMENRSWNQGPRSTVHGSEFTDYKEGNLCFYGKKLGSTTLKYGTFINLNLKPLMESPSSASRPPKQTFAEGGKGERF